MSLMLHRLIILSEFTMCILLCVYYVYNLESKSILVSKYIFS